MSTALDYVEAALAVTRRDIRVFRTYRFRFPAQVLRSFIAVALFYYISRLVTVAPFYNPEAYFAYVVVGLVIMELMFSTLNALPGRVRHEVVAGTFERFVVSPFGATSAVISMSVFPLDAGTLERHADHRICRGIFGMPVRWATLPLSLPIALVGCLCFVALALLAAASVILFKEAQVGVGFLTTAISFVGGFVFPIALLPGWIQWTSDVQPFTPTLELLRNVLVGTPSRRLAVDRARQDGDGGGHPAAVVGLGTRGRHQEEPATRNDHRVLTMRPADTPHRIDARPDVSVARRTSSTASFALETVVVNLERGVYHGLNPTAGRMLEALERASTRPRRRREARRRTRTAQGRRRERPRRRSAPISSSAA